MIISNETFELNRKIKKNMESSTDEVDRMLYEAARKYINVTEAEAQRVSKLALERAIKVIKQGYTQKHKREKFNNTIDWMKSLL